LGDLSQEFSCHWFIFINKFKLLVNFISGTENPNFFIEFLDELELFIDKNMIFDENSISVGPPRRLSAVCQQNL
jgi:hypothetical protein